MTFGHEGRQNLTNVSMLGIPSAVKDQIIPASDESDLEEVAKTLIDMEGKVDFDKNPFTYNWSPLVMDSSKSTLFEFDSNKYTLSASLPSACQELYHNVVQEGVYLDWPPGVERYKLSDAVRHSLNSKDGLLHKKLKEKTGEFGKHDKNATYLRVTLGSTRGNSPGIPYVLEIWPKGHGSPIHNHGNAYAVINVIHGGLTISIYNKDTDSTQDKELQCNSCGSPGFCPALSELWLPQC